MKKPLSSSVSRPASRSARSLKTLAVPRNAAYLSRRRGLNAEYAAVTAPFWNPIARLRAEVKAERERERIRRRQDRFAPQRFTEQFRTALRSDEVYAAVRAAAQRLPPDMRDDVISDLIVAVLDGEITIADLPKEIGRFRAAHNRMFGIWTPSLDADLGNGFTLGNSLAAAYI